MKRGLLLAALAVAAAYPIVSGPGEPAAERFSFDTFGYFYPNMLYALRSLAAGGQGLLWNPFQSCGQPFFGITETGLLYPLNALFLLLPPATALRALLFANLFVGGLGTYALGRELGVSRVGSLGGALAFMLGPSAYHLTTWMPTVQAPYVWMPAAMLCGERLMKAPRLSHALLLGLALAAGLLAGHPQFVLFTCQLLALRVLWGAFDRIERRHVFRALGGLALAVALMLLLTAVQFLESLRVISESVRGGSLLPEDIAPRGTDTLAQIAKLISSHSALAPFTVVPAFLAPAALIGNVRRRAALFYLVAAALFFTLSFGQDTPLGRLYYDLPFGDVFRHPLRFRFVTGFCVSVLIGLGIDAVAGGGWRAVAVAAAALVSLALWVDIEPLDWGLVSVLLGAGAFAAARPGARSFGAGAIVCGIGIAAVLEPPWTSVRFLSDDGPLDEHAALFERLRARMTPHDRVLAVHHGFQPGFQEKTAMLFEIPSLTDYEGQLSLQYAQYFAMLRRQEDFVRLSQAYMPGHWRPRSVGWRLVQLAAARYLIIPNDLVESFTAVRGTQFTPIDRDHGLQVFENGGVLPRAYYVPQLDVIGRDKLLRDLNAFGANPRRWALVDSEPASGFLGVRGNRASPEARFVVDEPERVVLDVAAPERGFLFLADQYFPAWSATVNGNPTPILRANHMFRLVEVPAGPVRVEFRYQSRRVWIGAAISAVTLALVVMLLIVGRRRRTDAPSG